MEDFVTFEIAKKLKEKGFRCEYPFAMYSELGVFYALFTSADHNHNIKSVFGDREYYDYDDFDEKDCVCPTISQVLKWLRKEKGMEVYSNYNRVYKHWTYIARAFDDSCYNGVGGFKSYEQAALAGIEYVLDNLI